MVLLRRPDLAVMTKTMRAMFGREPRVEEAERLNTEFLHSGVEIKFKALEPDVYGLIAQKPKLMRALQGIGVNVVPVVDLSKPRDANPPLPWFAKPHRDAYGTGCRTVSSWEEAARLVPERDFVQVKATNHPSLVPSLGSDGLATLRVFTGCPDPNDPSAVFLDTCMQIPLKGRVISNTSQGNLCAVVHRESCTLGLAAKFEFESHYLPKPELRRVPDRDVEFTGVKLPFLEEAIDMCVTGHTRLLGKACYLGWDVALTASGPQVLECNTFCSTGIFGAALTQLNNCELGDLLLKHISAHKAWHSIRMDGTRIAWFTCALLGTVGQDGPDATNHLRHFIHVTILPPSPVRPARSHIRRGCGATLWRVRTFPWHVTFISRVWRPSPVPICATYRFRVDARWTRAGPGSRRRRRGRRQLDDNDNDNDDGDGDDAEQRSRDPSLGKSSALTCAVECLISGASPPPTPRGRRVVAGVLVPTAANRASLGSGSDPRQRLTKKGGRLTSAASARETVTFPNSRARRPRSRRPVRLRPRAAGT
eukprot:scaffold1_cov402-Prasinococcus_capsulatus_cf.AAC.49